MSEQTLFNQSLFSEEIPIEERHLVEPMLLVLAMSDINKKGPIGNFEMSTILSSTLVMSKIDEAIVRKRGNSTLTRFQRTINNAISHDILTKHGWAKKVPGGMTITNKGYSRLLDNMLTSSPSDKNNDGPTISTEAERSFESAIAFRMLVALAELKKEASKPVPMSELRTFVKSSMVLSPDDVAKLSNRNDTKIDQIIRNVVAHNTLSKNGLAKYHQGKGLAITKKGEAYVSKVMLASFPTPDFEEVKAAAKIYKDIVKEKRNSNLKQFPSLSSSSSTRMKGP